MRYQTETIHYISLPVGWNPQILSPYRRHGLVTAFVELVTQELTSVKYIAQAFV